MFVADLRLYSRFFGDTTMVVSYTLIAVVACLVSRTGTVVTPTADRAIFVDTSTSVCVEILTISSTGVDAVVLFGLMISTRGHLSVCLGRGWTNTTWKECYQKLIFVRGERGWAGNGGLYTCQKRIK
jgi:hypothetical protein